MKARGEQMERLIGAMGGETPSQHPVPSKYVTAEQMERLIEAAGSGQAGGGSLPDPGSFNNQYLYSFSGKWLVGGQYAAGIKAVDTLSNISGTMYTAISQMVVQAKTALSSDGRVCMRAPVTADMAQNLITGTYLRFADSALVPVVTVGSSGDGEITVAPAKSVKRVINTSFATLNTVIYEEMLWDFDSSNHAWYVTLGATFTQGAQSGYMLVDVERRTYADVGN